MTPAIRVAVLEDNEALLEELLFQLGAQGFVVHGAQDSRALDHLLAQHPADVLVLDINLPGEDGFSVARRLHNPDRLGIILLTARDAIEDKLRGLEGGADLYLVKPVDRRELAAAIRALFRRLPSATAADNSNSNSNSNDNDNGWSLQPARRMLRAPGGRELELSPMEFRVFDWLRQEQGRTRSRRELITLLGIEDLPTSDGRVNTCVSRLRQKLADFDTELRVVSWRNQGYAYVGPSIQVLQEPAR